MKFRKCNVRCVDCIHKRGSVNDLELLKYTLVSFSYLLPVGEVTAKEFAEVIRANASLSVPKNNACYQLLLSAAE